MLNYDYLLVNDQLDDAIKSLEGIRCAEKIKYKRFLYLKDKFKEELKEIID